MVNCCFWSIKWSWTDGRRFILFYSYIEKTVQIPDTVTCDGIQLCIQLCLQLCIQLCPAVPYIYSYIHNQRRHMQNSSFFFLFSIKLRNHMLELRSWSQTTFNFDRFYFYCDELLLARLAFRTQTCGRLQTDRNQKHWCFNTQS